MKKFILFSILILILPELNGQIKSYKRGVAYGHHSANDMANFSKNISWWYNWAPLPEFSIRNNYSDYNIDFTPMAWNSSGINGVRNWVNSDSNVKYILGFNEPNFIEQANMTPSQAANVWHYIENIAEDHNLEIVGPAVNYCGNCVTENGITFTNPFTYLDKFFEACDSCQVDHIALHWYGGGNSIVNYVNTARKYNKPIWVTEFAAWDNSVNNAAAQRKYLAGTVNFLERDPDVYRYSWFIGRTQSGPSSHPYIDLYGADGTLTELGQIYMDIPVYDPDYKFEIPGKIEAEEYYLVSGLFAEITSDNDGFLNLGWTSNNDWAEYKINVQKSGNYFLHTRVAGVKTGRIDFLVDSLVSLTLNTPNTGGWQTWKTVSDTIYLEEGEHILKMKVAVSGFNINWIGIYDEVLSTPNIQQLKTKIYPNPVTANIITINTGTGQSGGDYICTLHDLAGKQLFREKVRVNGSTFKLNLDNPEKPDPGIYILTVEGNNRQSKSKLIIK